jgi:dolichol-phosphate mannosyltransferase
MKTIIFIPTYNEAENIQQLITELISLYPDYEILVVDDNSPDGTANIIKNLNNPKIHLFVRKEQRGRGLAGIFGFKKSIELGADYIIEMDGDLSHSPKYISDFIRELKEHDVVLGSRYIKSGKDEQRTILRKIISFIARKYIQFILGLDINDPTTGFRAYRNYVLEKIVPHLKSKDPFICTEILYYCKKYNFNIKEIPICFEKRFAGKSKLNFIILLKYLFRVIQLKYGTE